RALRGRQVVVEIAATRGTTEATRARRYDERKEAVEERVFRPRDAQVGTECPRVAFHVFGAIGKIGGRSERLDDRAILLADPENVGEAVAGQKQIGTDDHDATVAGRSL